MVFYQVFFPFFFNWTVETVRGCVSLKKKKSQSDEGRDTLVLYVYYTVIPLRHRFIYRILTSTVQTAELRIKQASSPSRDTTHNTPQSANVHCVCSVIILNTDIWNKNNSQQVLSPLNIFLFSSSYCTKSVYIFLWYWALQYFCNICLFMVVASSRQDNSARSTKKSKNHWVAFSRYWYGGRA